MNYGVIYSRGVLCFAGLIQRFTVAPSLFVNRSAHARLLVRRRTEDFGPNHSLSGLNGTEWLQPGLQQRFGREPKTGKAVRRVLSHRREGEPETHPRSMFLRRIERSLPALPVVSATHFSLVAVSFFIFLFGTALSELRSSSRSSVQSSPTRFNSHRRPIHSNNKNYWGYFGGLCCTGRSYWGL